LLVLVPLVVGALAGLLAGGRPASWADLHLRWPWLVVAALLVREAVALTPLDRIDALRYVYLAFAVVLLAWTVWHFSRLPGIWVVSVGAALNLAVILANSARMPVAPAGAGVRLLELGHQGQYVLMDSSTMLNGLGDWIVLPAWLGRAYSPGDFAIGLGIGIVSFLVSRRPATATKLDETSSGTGSYPP
jgi:hypothetical protein